MTAALVPVFTGIIQNTAVQLCDARALHTFMDVRRDFSNWIKGRIAKFGFAQDVDYLLAKSGEQVPHQGGLRTVERIDYHLTLDMAKELAMVENNAKGREVRRYFIECERRALQPATITPTQQQHLKELVDLVAESGRQTHSETWARLHRKFGVPRYTDLPAAQFDAACQYLRAKLDAPSIATLVQKHLPDAAPPSLQHRRWLVSFDHRGQEQHMAVPNDAFALSLNDLPAFLLDADTHPRPDQLAAIASACVTRLAQVPQAQPPALAA